MSAPNDINSQIAFKRGWTWSEHALRFVDTQGGTQQPTPSWTHWQSPQGYASHCPDYVGTVQGVSIMIQALNDWERSIGSTKRWYITHVPNGFTCQRRVGVEAWDSYTSKHLGCCVGEAYVSTKEAADES